MRRSVAIRLGLFIVATLVSLVYLAPTFVHDLPPWWSSFCRRTGFTWDWTYRAVVISFSK
jgi:hypothetical protein